MHEYSIVKKEVERLSERINGKKAHKVVFSLGRLAHGTPESITAAFKAATADTALFQTEVQVLNIEPKVKCLSCRITFGVAKEINLTCPSCGSSSNELIAGQECYISSVEIE